MATATGVREETGTGGEEAIRKGKRGIWERLGNRATGGKDDETGGTIGNRKVSSSEGHRVSR
jgi:hypothetical protein